VCNWLEWPNISFALSLLFLKGTEIKKVNMNLKLTYPLNYGWSDVFFFVLVLVTHEAGCTTVTSTGSIFFKVTEDFVEVLVDEVFCVNGLSWFEWVGSIISTIVLLLKRIKVLFDLFHIIIIVITGVGYDYLFKLISNLYVPVCCFLYLSDPFVFKLTS